ncbi:MAG: WYL domain-containing protein, partial [Kofleriaceae bacterium]
LSVLKKLEQRMSEKERAEHAAFGEQLVYMPDHGTKSYDGKEDMIDAIQSGIINRKVVRYRYAAGRGRTESGFLAPFRLAMYRHGLYAIGARLRQADGDVSTAPLGVFAVERFTDTEYIKQHGFQIPENSRVREVLEGSFGPHLPDVGGPHDAVVEFSAEKAHLVSSRTWHPSQQVETLPNGRLQLRLRVPSLAPLVSWILEWGPHALAVAPAALVSNVRRELAAALLQYEA